MSGHDAESVKLAWSALNELRGTLPVSVAKQYLLCLIVLKFLGDLREADPQDKRLWIKSEFLDNVDFSRLSQEAEPSKYLDKLIAGFEQAGPEALRGTFFGLSFERDLAAQPGGVRSLVQALQLILGIDLRIKSRYDSVIEDTFESIVEQFSASEGRDANFETPRELADLMTRVADPKSGNTIYDPFCRSGSILASLFKRKRSAVKICGQESAKDLWASCRLNLFMHGATDSDIRCSDPLRSPFVDKLGGLQKFDIVVSNPPFGRANWYAEEWEHDLFERFRLGTPPKHRVEYAFLLHMVESAREGSGKIVTLLPMGALFRGGNEGQIRERLIEKNLLDCVVALPANLFYGTGIPVALLFLRKDKSDQRITFIDASRGFVSGRNRNKLAKEHADAILQALKGRFSRKGYSRKVSLEEVRKQGYNLSVGIYVMSENYEEGTSIQRLRQEVHVLDNDLFKVRNELDSILKEME